MKLFSSPRTNRITINVMLFVWMFAWVSGVANACLLQDYAEHIHDSQVINSNVPETGSEDLGGLVTSGAFYHHTESDVSIESCLHVCDDCTRGAVTDHLADPHPADKGPPPLFTVVWLPSESNGFYINANKGQRINASGPPIRTRFSRLAL